MEWQFENDRPIYLQLVEQVQRALLAGRYPPGAKLPGVREMAAEAGVNPNTMQRALAELETLGLVNTQRTSGRFVTEDAGSIGLLRERLALATAGVYVKKMRELGCSENEIAAYVTKVKEQE